ncbi:DNA-binding protein [Vandammella animalimorsus]|uniref:DNA-binding protein n=1 Tax=Vandammella animalimorsus TaxID=2029117 RepID=A0A2A2A6Q9_9BURK|nr:DNA-binding protein [Vandammella animalimorsus]PAT32888.1 DNA-binding protein [Vandammella animalimorsus]
MKPRYKLLLDGSLSVITPRTHAQARQWLSEQGITVTQWARDHGFSTSLVFEVLYGRKRCLRGKSHNIAVLLGMKHGQLTDKPARVSPAQRQQEERAAA